MTNRTLQVVSDTPIPVQTGASVQPLRHASNQRISDEQWQQIAPNLPVGETITVTTTTTRSQTFSRGRTEHQLSRANAGNPIADAVLMAVVMIVVIVGVAGGVIGFFTIMAGGV